MKNELTWEYLISILEYDPDTGDFIRIKNTSLRTLAGEQAGSINNSGYINITINGTIYSGHRLAWFYCFKEWPLYNIDHIDRNRSNNKLDNLRDVTQSINIRNATHKVPLSGYTGVTKSGKGWKASSELQGKYIYLGTYSSAIEASEAFNKYKNIQYENIS